MAPITMTRTPVRVSFFGGGTDYPEFFLKNGGGAVLGSSIDKYSYITASNFLSKLFSHKIRISYRTVEDVSDVESIEHPVYREALKFCDIEKDVELHNVADMPGFSGLGSSSTFTVGLLQALRSFTGQVVSGIQLAYEAIHIERNILKENVGLQDQTFAAVGGFNIIEFFREDDIRVWRVPISPGRIRELQSHLMLIFTRSTRRASDIAANQLKNVDKNQQMLRRIRKMVDEGLQILANQGSLTPFGELLHEGWQIKRSLATNVSNSDIDAMYQLALENGAVGGKLLGAGGGGFLLLFAPPEKHTRLCSVFSKSQEVHFSLNAPGAEVIL